MLAIVISIRIIFKYANNFYCFILVLPSKLVITGVNFNSYFFLKFSLYMKSFPKLQHTIAEYHREYYRQY